MIGSYPTIIDIGKARLMVVISRPSPVISVTCLCCDAKGSDYGLYERCFNNIGSLSPICGLPVVRPMLGLVKPLHSSLLWQELIELGPFLCLYLDLCMI
ncbi:hypothetical protein V6N13_024550 [Hibiscus sabdariffa]